MVRYISTRGADGRKPNGISFSDSILTPSASYGGLYVPDGFKNFSIEELKALSKMSYEDLAFEILSSFGVEIDKYEIYDALGVYKRFDNPKNPAPVKKLSKAIYVQELWHGPTRAFKDMALGPFPYLLSHLAQLHEKKYLVATATSGDTGPAALEGFRDLPNTKVVCYYPVEGTSRVQAEQMKKARGKNVKVVGVKTDFDGIQRKLKEMLRSEEVNSKLHQSGFELSAANSVNFGRIVFQVVYHFWSYFELVRNSEIRMGESVIYNIPSGNFGNALGAFYAKIMGLPIEKINLASNKNNVLTSFVNRGIYDLRAKKLIKTISPAMDILISSNVERLLHYLFGEKRTLELMLSLENEKYFALETDEINKIQKIFSAHYATDEKVENVIKNVFYDFRYLLDPHTAVSFCIPDSLVADKKVIISSTAEWTKFPETVANVFDCKPDFESITTELKVKLPLQISQLESMPFIHDLVIEVDDMNKELLDFV